MGIAVVDDLSVLEADDAVRLHRDGVVMGDEDHSVPLPVQLFQKAQHLPTGAGVQCAGGLVSQDDRRAARQGPGDGHPLLLAAGELGGQVPALVRQPYPLERGHGSLLPLRGVHPGIEQGELHVFQHVQLGDQVILLEDEAQHFVADLGLLVVVHGRHVDPAQMIGP